MPPNNACDLRQWCHQLPAPRHAPPLHPWSDPGVEAEDDDDRGPPILAPGGGDGAMNASTVVVVRWGERQQTKAIVAKELTIDCDDVI